jgi:hypothetical protein
MLFAGEAHGELHMFWDQRSTLQLVKHVEKWNIEEVLNPCEVQLSLWHRP